MGFLTDREVKIRRFGRLPFSFRPTQAYHHSALGRFGQRGDRTDPGIGNRICVLTDNSNYPNWDGLPKNGEQIVGRVIWAGMYVA